MYALVFNRSRSECKKIMKTRSPIFKIPLWHTNIFTQFLCLGFSSIYESEVTGTGGDWLRVDFRSPNTALSGQFKRDASDISNGRYVW